MSEKRIIHYQKKDGSLSCGSIIGFFTYIKNNVTCTICKMNIKKED